jgi:hypothetical protein
MGVHATGAEVAESRVREIRRALAEPSPHLIKGKLM